MVRILSVVGTRPNFIKIAPLIAEFNKHKGINHTLVHTGQHYDKEMSGSFFDDLGLPMPDINLSVGSGTYGEQVGNAIIKLEEVMSRISPDLVVVVGDVNSTFAGAFVARQLGIKVAHVEAGLRSFDWKMPEEINRMLTDRISNFLFTTEESANSNLLNEGINKGKIFFVGNVMVDTLLSHREKSKESAILKKLNLKKNEYCAVTLHRPSNVDSKESLERIISLLESLQERIKIVFPAHPRTKKNLHAFKLIGRLGKMKNVVLAEPLGYLDFMCLVSNSKFTLTDSGGLQEETTILGVPCITLRDSTERPITSGKGTNLLVSTDNTNVLKKSGEIIDGKIKIGKSAPELWDGRAAERIVSIILKNFDK